jgi:hypothetical protein
MPIGQPSHVASHEILIVLIIDHAALVKGGKWPRLLAPAMYQPSLLSVALLVNISTLSKLSDLQQVWQGVLSFTMLNNCELQDITNQMHLMMIGHAWGLVRV